MFKASLTPDVVTNEPKINGVTAAGKAPITEGMGERRWVTRGDTYE